MRSNRRVVLVLVVLLAGGACGSDDEPTPEAGGDATSTAAPTTSAVSPATSSGVKLEEPGAQPRQPLILKVSPGSASRVTMVSKIGLDLSVGGQTLPSGALPDTRMVLDQRVDRVDPDGTAHYTVTFTEVSAVAAPGVEPALVRQVQASLDQLEGLRGTGTFDAHGGGQTLTFDTRTVTDPTMKSTIDSISSQVGNLAAPFPTEPVGRGARWTAERSATINGITMNTTSQYTLRSRTGDRYEIDVTQNAVAPKGPASIPNMPAGASASIVDFSVRSDGKVSGDLTRLLPISSSLSGEGDGTMTITAGGERQTLVQHLTLELTLSSS